jgi:hypothetical protein
MDLHAWGRQRAQYSRARRGRNERGAILSECALVQGITEAMAVRQGIARPSAAARPRLDAPTESESRPAA